MFYSEMKGLKLSTLNKFVVSLIGLKSQHMYRLLFNREILTLPRDSEDDDKLFSKLISMLLTIYRTNANDGNYLYIEK